MPESGDVDILTPPRVHLASRRRFDLKLDLTSTPSGRERGEKKLRLELLTAPILDLPSKVADINTNNTNTAPTTTTTSASTTITSTTTTTTGCSSCLNKQTGASPDEGTDVSSGPLAPVRTVTAGELATKLRKARSVLVIDCRSFLDYNLHHVQGAVNVSCTDRFNRRRLQQGKVGVLDLLAAHGKDHLRRKHVRDIVLYDGRSNGSCGGEERPDGESALHTVLTTLIREGRQPAILLGGMKQFEAEYPDLCWSARRQDIPGRPLCSPTNDTMEPEIETATASQVLPFLYLGNERDAAELERLRRHNITYVLNVTAHVPQYWHAHGIRYKRIPASDSAQQNLKQYFEEAIEYIDDARQNGACVLIHCHAGVSRSATITIAYILKHTKMAMSDAYKYVKGKRSIICPNFNFMGQLLEFEQDLNQGNSPRILNPRLQGLESTV